MEADGAGEQMRPLLTRVRSGEAEARRQRRRRGGAAGGLSRRPRAAVAFVWRGSRGPAARGRPAALADGSPEGARVRRPQRPARSLAAPAAAFSLRVDAAVLEPGCSSCARRPSPLAGPSVPALCGVSGRRPGEGPCGCPPPGPMERERTASPAQRTPLSQ